MSQPFKLSAELHGHTADVRGVGASQDGTLLTGSRDFSVRVWKKTAEYNTYTSDSALESHQNYVQRVIAIPSCTSYPGGALVSASNDKTAIIWEYGQPSQVLAGHTEAVSALSWNTSTEELITGSWDCTAKVWSGGKCVRTLKGHEKAVWAVMSVGTQVFTGSSDHSIKIWEGEVCVSTLSGHSDCVRSLTLVPGMGFLSASNDCTAKLWSLKGDPLLTCVGHNGYVYATALLPSGQFLTCGEDKSVRIWEGAECVGNIPHPGVVWDVCALPNGDILTGCSDGVARVWTRELSRVAEHSVLETYEANLAAQLLPKQALDGMLGGVDLNKLDGPEALGIPGTKEGETKIIREADGADVYSWSSGEAKWVKIGALSDGPGEDGGSGKKWLNGVEYDEVIDIALDDNAPSLKLGFNYGDNPWTVAQQFLWLHELPQDHLETIANYLTQKMSSTSFTNTQAADPLTGGGRYIPGQASGGGGGAIAGAYDPFTGGNRYVPGTADPPAPMAAPPAQANPHIRGAYTTTGPQTVNVIPKDNISLFDAASPNIAKKLMEFNTLVGEQAMSDAESAAIGVLLTNIKDPKAIHSTSTLKLLTSRLLRWPEAQLFPVLDMLRLLVLHPQGAKIVVQPDVDVVEVLLPPRDTLPPMPVRLMTLRFFVNCFKRQETCALVKEHRGRILDDLANSLQFEQTPVRLAFATLALNYAVVFRSHPDEEGKLQTLSSMVELLDGEKDEEVLVRALTVVGTLIHSDSQMKSTALELGVAVKVKELSALSNRVGEVARELLALLA